MNRVCQIALVAFLFAFSVAAQPFPDAETLLNRSLQNPGGRQSVEFIRDLSWQGEAGLPGAANESGLFQFSDGKFRIEFKTGPSPLLLVMDGQYLWEYRSVAKEYGKIPRPAADVYGGSVINGGSLGNQKAFGGRLDDRVVRSEVIDVDGQSRDCWVTEGRAATAIPVMRSGFEMRNLMETAWYDKVLGVVLRRELSAELRTLPSGVFAPLQMKLTTRGLKINPSLDNSLFVFMPPPGARDSDAPVAELPAYTGSLDPALLASPMPVKRVQPIYPPLARAARIQGQVKFVATISKDGSVKELSVVSGPPLLLEAAAAAARQWTYQPTVLNGSPVEVKTIIELNFTLTPAVAPK